MTNSIPVSSEVSKDDRAVADISCFPKTSEGKELFTGQAIAGLDLPTPVPVGQSELEVVLSPHGLQHDLDLTLQEDVEPPMPREERWSNVGIVDVGWRDCMHSKLIFSHTNGPLKG